ncbi:MAG: class I SAM-dependent RNA methyltransferase, partial [Anaerolineae bacterium]|nr:class I SAM-dependent RNA methyltransferase [Anaerolineae bacterium]
MSDSLTLIATTRMGLEKVVKLELQSLGYEDVQVSNGRLEIAATLADIPYLNLWLRTAERLLIKMGEFQADTFETLFDECRAI